MQHSVGDGEGVCASCGFERLVPFSCKSREICPSCTSRRMAEVSAHLVDRVLPDVPVRQWVLTVPWALRGWLARDRELISTVLRIFVEEMFRWLFGPTVAKPQSGAKGGALTFIQRFGNTLNLHVHFHVVALDGLYGRDTETGELVFHPSRCRPREEDERSVAKAVHRRMVRLFRRRGWMDELGRLLFPEEPTSPLPFSDQTAFRFLGPGTEARPRRESRSRGEYGGFSVHAGVQIRQGDKSGREKLVRYAARPPFAFEQVQRTESGQVLFHLKKPRTSGQQAMLLDPIDFLRRLAWLVPPPWFNQIRYHGVLAPASKWRKEVVPAPEVELDLDASAAFTPALSELPPPGARYDWAKLLARVWSIDVTECPKCEGKVRIIAAIKKPDAIQRILSHLGLPTEAPKVRGARGPPMNDLFDET